MADPLSLAYFLYSDLVMYFSFGGISLSAEYIGLGTGEVNPVKNPSYGPLMVGVTFMFSFSCNSSLCQLLPNDHLFYLNILLL